jgi:enediyne biosynthesis protein E4
MSAEALPRQSVFPILRMLPLPPRPLLVVASTFLVLSLQAAPPTLQSSPLAPPSRAGGATLFTPLGASQTGLVTENNYADPKMWGDRYQEFALGAMGTGVAVGDFDNDGRPDLFVVSKTGQNRLFRNLGDWKFADVTVKAGIARNTGALEQGLSWVRSHLGSAEPEVDVSIWKQGVTFVDVNNDGWLDIYVCRFGAPNLLYINQGNGTFKEEAAARGLAVVDASGMGAFCDFDRDGWLDVYIQTNMYNAAAQPNGRRDYLFRNRGDGTFEDVTVKAGITGENLAHSVTWWDYDQDGWPDIYVANDFALPDRLYRNNRDGTFTNVIHQVVPRIPYSAMGADLGDVNNDGWMDLLVGDMAATTHEKDQRAMVGSRELAREDSDSVVHAPQVLHSTLYLNTGTGRMLEAATLAGIQATDWTWSVRFADLDNDGWLDLHVTNGMNREYHNTDLRERIVSTEHAGERLRMMKASPMLAEANLAYRNLGDLRFEDVSAAWGLNQTGVSFGAAFADFDGDGDLDLVFANYEDGVTVLRNDSPGGGRVIIALRGTSSNRFGVGATVRAETEHGTQMRQLVLARGYLSSSEPVLHFGLGELTSIQRLVVDWPSGHRQVFQDLAAGNRYVVTEPSGPATPPPAVAAKPPLFRDESKARNLSLHSEESFQQEQQPLIPFRFDRRGPALAVGDLTGDDRLDLFLGGTSRQAAQAHLATGKKFAPGPVLPMGRVDDGPILLLDVDGDGRADLLQTRGGASRPAGSPDYQPLLWWNRGGAFEPAHNALPSLPISVGAAAAADFDRDGRLDVFLGGRLKPGKYPTAPHSALLRNVGGRFEDVTGALAPALREIGLVTSALWSDVDLDGWPDLLVTLEWGGVKYFRNEQGRGFSDQSTAAGFAAAGTGWWTSLASGDFNGDGRPDFVAGNVGLNTPYRSPALLFSGRFASSNATQIIEAHYENDRLYPRRSLQTLSAQIPGLRRKFPRNDEFARATVAEIFGEDRVAAADRYEAHEFRSGVFLSQPDGRYRFAPLPRIVQIAPLQGIVTGDFDRDGHLDIFAVQNSYAPIPSTGRFDGGLSQLLRGDGRGGFTPVPPIESGLVVPGDAKALVVVDLDDDGWPDFIISRNNNTTLAFRSSGATDRTPLRIALRGPAGNPTGVGARVTLEFADGTTMTREITAGGGYYSQSSPLAFFSYTPNNPPRLARVRWPSGTETQARPPKNALHWTISTDSR